MLLIVINEENLFRILRDQMVFFYFYFVLRKIFVWIGTAVITDNEALLWTDGRYFAQAENELDSKSWKLMRDGTKDVLSITNWLSRVNFYFLYF
jgi:hypothetical protein